jgi:hypothetical protein
MDFVKKHYDKIILGAVLLGVIGFLVFLPFVISHEQDALTDMVNNNINLPAKPLPPVDLTRETNISQRVQSPAEFDFSSTNKLFNPVEWIKKPDGTLLKIKNGDEPAVDVVVSNISQLNFVLSFDSVETNGTSPRYVIGLEHQAAANPAMRRKTQRYVSLDDPKKDAFTLIQAKGPPENPDELELKLADTGETVVIAPGKPYQHTDAYAADLRYDPDKKNFPGRRVGSMISFAGGDYIVVAIDKDEVVLLNQSNQKKTTLRYAP